MTDGVRSVLRFLSVTCTSLTVLIASACGAPTQDAAGSMEPEITPIKEVRAELVADVARVNPGDSFRIGVLLTIPQGSHIYWKNPGASGLPTGVEWTLAEGLEAEELLWPAPKRFEIEGWDEISFGYESEVLLSTKVRTTGSMPEPQPILIAAQVNWLNCEEDGQCIPGKAEIQLAIPVGAEPEPSQHRSSFERYQQRVPVPLNSETVPFSLEREEGASFTVQPRSDARIDFDGPGGAPDFFPHEGEAWTFERMPGQEAGSPESLRFRPPGSGAVASGVLKVPVRWEDSGARRVFYLSLSE